jgi:predicted DNA-binding transcriptional regulator AlpA
MIPENKSLETLLNEHDVARIIGLSVATVRRWRLFKRGPRYIKLGAAVRYSPRSIASFLESVPTGGGDDQSVENLKGDRRHE